MLKIEGVTYGSFGQLATSNYLHGNLQDDVGISLRYSIERTVFISEDRTIWLTPPPYILGSVDNVGIIYDVDGQQSFAEFQKGDEIYVSTAVSTVTTTISEKIDNNTIRVSGSIPSSERTVNGEFIACTKAPKSIRYRFNFISTDDNVNYINHLDGQEMLFEATNLPSFVGSTLSLTQKGSKSHQLGSATIRCYSIVNSYKFLFEIVHITKLFPLLNEGYIQLLQSDQVLEDWAGDKCYNYAYSLELLSEQDNETDKVNIEGVEEGNTGSYDEHFNTSNTGFYVDGLPVYTVEGNIVNGLDFDKITNVSLTYKSDGKFIPTLKTEVTFLVAHDDFNNYLDTNQYYLENFCFGRAGTSGIINLGNDYRVFTSFSQTIVDANTLNVSFNVSLGAKAKENISKSDPKKYILAISCEQSGLSVPNQVRSRDIIHIAEFVETLTVAQFINTSSQFWLDPADINAGYIQELPDTFMTDDVLAVSRFSYPKSLDIKILSVKNELIAQGSSTVILDSVTTSLASSPLDPNDVQLPSVSSFRALNQSYKSTLLIGRGTDTLTENVFQMVFPFIVGYRDDKPIINQSIPAEVYELGAVGNGLSNDWFRYIDAGMAIKYRVTYIVEYNGKRYTQEYLKQINVNNYDNPEWTAKSIKLYDTLGVELIDGSDKIIKGITTIKATFDKAVLPSITDLQCYFFVAKTGEDGYRTSSAYDNSFKKIIFGSLSIIGGEVVAEGELNAEDFQSDVRIWARLFEKTADPLPPCVLIAEDGTYLIYETGGYLIPETCGETPVDRIWDSLGDFLADSMGDNLIAL